MSRAKLQPFMLIDWRVKQIQNSQKMQPQVNWPFVRFNLLLALNTKVFEMSGLTPNKTSIHPVFAILEKKLDQWNLI